MSKAITDSIVKELTFNKELSEMWHNLKNRRIGAITRYVLEDGERQSPETHEFRSFMIEGPTGEHTLLTLYQNIMKRKLRGRLKGIIGKSIDEKEFGLLFLEAKDIMMEKEEEKRRDG